MEKWNKFMEKVKTDEALQKEFAEIHGDGGVKLTKEQKEKIAELVAKSRIELDMEGKLSESIVGGVGVVWRPIIKPPTLTMEWKTDTYRCKNCGRTKMVSLAESVSLGLENDCPAGDFLGHHEYEMIE